MCPHTQQAPTQPRVARDDGAARVYRISTSTVGSTDDKNLRVEAISHIVLRSCEGVLGQDWWEKFFD